MILFYLLQLNLLSLPKDTKIIQVKTLSKHVSKLKFKIIEDGFILENNGLNESLRLLKRSSSLFFAKYERRLHKNINFSLGKLFLKNLNENIYNFLNLYQNDIFYCNMCKKNVIDKYDVNEFYKHLHDENIENVCYLLALGNLLCILDSKNYFCARSFFFDAKNLDYLIKKKILCLFYDDDF